MKIILKKDIENLGLGGEIVDVADGYARNYLLPKKFAIVATKRNTVKIEKIKEEASIERKKIVAELENIAKELNEEVFTYMRKVDENEGLYGSVSISDIKKSIVEKIPNIKKFKINLEDSIKELGEFEVEVNFINEIKSIIKIVVQKED